MKVKYINSTLRDSEGYEILGKISFDPLEIAIFADVEGAGAEVRRRFTLAHELGHLLLGHSAYMSGEYCQENDLDIEHLPDLGVKDITRLEWQANCFASCLLLPKNIFLSDFLSLAADSGLNNRGFGVLFVDDQPCNLDNYYKITNYLRMKYDVSRSVVRIRLEKAGLLNDQRQKWKLIN